MGKKLLAEWAPQAATLLCWPHAGTDWAPRLAAIQQEYLDFIRAIRRFQPVLVLVNDSDSEAQLLRGLADHPAGTHPVLRLSIPFDDTWVRDFGPLTLADGQNARLLSLRFDGWGGKYDGSLNDGLCRALEASGIFGRTPFVHSDLVGEGGNLESDGNQTLLTSGHSFGRRNNPEIRPETRLRDQLGLENILWLDCPPLPGDDTDGHIDTLARFSEDGGIVWQPPPDAGAACTLERQLLAFGRPLHRLPGLPEIIDQGHALPASYANFLVVNEAVLVPAYDTSADTAAREVIQRAFPERRIVPVRARNLIWQYGSLHCASMQIPVQVDIRWEKARPC